MTLTEWADRLDAALDRERLTVRDRARGRGRAGASSCPGPATPRRRYVAAAETASRRRGGSAVSEDARGTTARSCDRHAPRTTASSRSVDRAGSIRSSVRRRRAAPRRRAARADRRASSATPACGPTDARRHRRGHGPGLVHGPARRPRDRQDARVRDRQLAIVGVATTDALRRAAVAARARRPGSGRRPAAGRPRPLPGRPRRGARAHRAGRARPARSPAREAIAVGVPATRRRRAMPSGAARRPLDGPARALAGARSASG